MPHRGVRERLEAREESLSPHATRSRLSRGRIRHEAPHPLCTEFQRDRDRIVHTNAFRRLKHKTQVFVAPLGDHYVTRLTHTLEVSLIARTICRALNLNEDLAEAISLGHDLGHTPFGHIGEEALDQLLPQGFSHNEQSLRVIDMLENDGKGLNLTFEVREGIRHHSKDRAEVLGEEWGHRSTLEAQVVKLADLFAYINHDVSDAIRAGLLAESDLPPASARVLGTTPSRRINTLVSDTVEASWTATGLVHGTPRIGMSPRVRRAAGELRDFLFERVYTPRSALDETQRAQEAVRLLFRFLLDHPEQLPPEYHLMEEPQERKVADFIAGMTDHYALRLAREVEPSRIWPLPAL
ncbi:MAG: deoxyguanosinetriphosphate triphosphohydrolase [Dehalococcoidia bacterium]|nr:deoxyguanosinetriphosphate triphosphohydrolase [Dehalococcoidia bacterium]